MRRHVSDELRRQIEGDIVDDTTLQAGLKDLYKTLKKDLATDPDLAFLAG